MQSEAYLERSKSVSLEVELPNVYPLLFESLVSHISRLAVLAVWMKHPSDFGRIVQHLPNPIPTLHKFTIIVPPRLDTLELTSGIGNDYFLRVKGLRLEGISSFRAPPAFPHATS
jgi:hypothetical protein